MSSLPGTWYRHTDVVVQRPVVLVFSYRFFTICRGCLFFPSRQTLFLACLPLPGPLWPSLTVPTCCRPCHRYERQPLPAITFTDTGKGPFLVCAAGTELKLYSLSYGRRSSSKRRKRTRSSRGTRVHTRSTRCGPRGARRARRARQAQHARRARAACTRGGRGGRSTSDPRGWHSGRGRHSQRSYDTQH